MDFDSDMNMLVGYLVKANSVKEFSKLTHRGGHEEDYKNVVKILREALTLKKLINEDGTIQTDIARKTNFFLIMNSTMKILEKYSESEDLYHLVWKTPKIPERLLIHIIWELKLDSYYCETIKYSSQDLSIDLLQIAKDNMKYIDPKESIIKVPMLVEAAYDSLNRMFDVEDKINIKLTLLDKFCECTSFLLKFLTMQAPNQKKLIKRNNKKFEHEGRLIINLIDLMYKCFYVFVNDTTDIKTECELYSCTFDRNYKGTKNNLDVLKLINKSINSINCSMMSTFQNAFHCVTVNMYTFWTEILIDNNVSLQNVIGYKAYKLSKLIKDHHAFDKNFVEIIYGIAQEPLSITEIIKKADFKTLYDNAQKASSDQALWIEALIKYKAFFEDTIIVKLVFDNIHLCDADVLDHVFMTGYEYLKSTEKENRSNALKMLVLKCFELMSLDVKKQKIFLTVEQNQTDDTLELDEYFTQLTVFLNKVLDAEKLGPELYSLFIQNPVMFYEKCFDVAVLNTNQAAVVITILKCFKLCKRPRIISKDVLTLYHHNADGENEICAFVSLPLNALRDLRKNSITSDTARANYVYLIENLMKENILDAPMLFHGLIVPETLSSLMDKNFEALFVYLETLDVVFVPEFAKKTVGILGYVLEGARWDTTNYSSSAVLVMNLATKLTMKCVDVIMKVPGIPEKDKADFCLTLEYMTPINIHYFRRLWGWSVQTPQFVSKGDAFADILGLSLVICRMTLQEVRDAYFVGLQTHPSLVTRLSILCEGIKVASKFVDQEGLNTETASMCYLYTCRNVAAVLQDCISLDRGNIEIVRSALAFILPIISNRPLKMQEDTMGCFLSVICNTVTILKIEPDTVKNIFELNPIANKSCQEVLRRILSTQLFNGECADK